MTYAVAMSPVGYALSDGAAMDMARDALAAARADFRALVCEGPGRGAGGGPGVGPGGGVAVARAAIARAPESRAPFSQAPFSQGGYPPSRQRPAVRRLALPVCANGPVSGGEQIGTAGDRGRVAGASVSAPVASRSVYRGRRGGGGLSWPGAQYLFIVAVMGLATIAAGLELMSQTA